MDNRSALHPPFSFLRDLRFWLLAFLVLLVGAIGYIASGQDFGFAVRLIYAKIVADRFYADYKGLTKDIPYGPLPAERLDVYQPLTPGKHPVIVFVHGGGWRNYSKELHAPVAQKLLPEDIVVVLPEYTLTKDASYKQQAGETASAIAWVLENIEKYGGDRTRVFVGGQSAGAHLAALAVLDKRWLAAVGHSSQELAGLYGIAGPYDINAQMTFERENGRDGQGLREVFGNEADFREGSPINYVRADLPPILLIHGDADETVPLGESEDFQAKLVAAGASSRLLIYPGAGHTGLLFDALVSNPARLIVDLKDFVAGTVPSRGNK